MEKEKLPVHNLVSENGITTIRRLKPPQFTAIINTKTFELSHIVFNEIIEQDKMPSLFKKAIAFTKHYLRSHDNK